MRTLGRCVLVGLLIVTGTGMTSCENARSRTSRAKVIRTKAEYFKAKQANTMTPYGAIDMESVKETSNGVEYTTADGKRWKVIMEPVGVGYKIREPEQIK